MLRQMVFGRENWRRQICQPSLMTFHSNVDVNERLTMWSDAAKSNDDVWNSFQTRNRLLSNLMIYPNAVPAHPLCCCQIFEYCHHQPASDINNSKMAKTFSNIQMLLSINHGIFGETYWRILYMIISMLWYSYILSWWNNPWSNTNISILEV